MLDNKKVNIVLAFIVAITLWAYVIGETNPTDTRTFREIPVTLINENILTDRGLAVESISDTYISVTLTGTRANMNGVTAEDVSAVVDLSEGTEGENHLKIDVRIPDGLEIEDRSTNKVTVEIAKVKSREVPVTPLYQGAFQTEQEPITESISPSFVTVTGAESKVDAVTEVKAVVKAGMVKSELKDIKCRLVPVDKKGTEVGKLELSEDTAVVSAQLASTKTVKLSVPVIDNTKDEIEKTYSVPETVVIKGKSEDIRGIDEVSAESVDISHFTEDTTVNLQLNLPDGVQLSSKSADALRMTVEVAPVESRGFSFDAKDIDITGLAENLKAVIGTNKVRVVVKGSRQTLNRLEKGDFNLSADVADLEQGDHDVKLEVTCRKSYGSIHAEPETINITIEESR